MGAALMSTFDYVLVVIVVIVALGFLCIAWRMKDSD